MGLKAFLLTDRFQVICHLCLSLQSQPSMTVWMCLRLLSHMSPSTQVVQFARLHLLPLQMWLRMVYHLTLHPLDRSLLQLVLDSWQWWTPPENICQSIPFIWPMPNRSVVTDASLLGLGAHLGSLKVQCWLEQETSLHINVLDHLWLWAIYTVYVTLFWTVQVLVHILT